MDYNMYQHTRQVSQGTFDWTLSFIIYTFSLKICDHKTVVTVFIFNFSSFRLAHMFPDCVGQVDIVSDAENIKKLLKIPYSRGVVSTGFPNL